MSNLEVRFNKVREYDETLYESTDEDIMDTTTKTKYALKGDTIELVANQIYDKLTILFNNTRKRLGIQNGEPILEPIRNYNNFKLADDGALTYVGKRTAIDLGDIDDGIETPSEIRCQKIEIDGFMTITDKDINPYKPRYQKAREKIRKLDENFDKRSKAIDSSSTTDAEARGY